MSTSWWSWWTRLGGSFPSSPSLSARPASPFWLPHLRLIDGSSWDHWEYHFSTKLPSKFMTTTEKISPSSSLLIWTLQLPKGLSMPMTHQQTKTVELLWRRLSSEGSIEDKFTLDSFKEARSLTTASETDHPTSQVSLYPFIHRRSYCCPWCRYTSAVDHSPLWEDWDNYYFWRNLSWTTITRENRKSWKDRQEM